MTAVHIRDRHEIADSQRVKLPNGMLRVPAVYARTGIQEYLAAELGLTDRAPHAVVRVLRKPEDVFKPEAVASFSMVPVTDDHPNEDVTAANAKRLAVGWASEAVTTTDTTIGGSLLLFDEGAVSRAEGKSKVELSCGYDCEMDWTGGVDPVFGAFDASMHNIVGNHVAIVRAGRCGPQCRIGDNHASEHAPCGCESCQESAEMADTKKIVVDGLGMVETTAEGEVAINKLVADVKAARDALAAKDGAADAAAATAADALKAATDKVAELEAKLKDTADLDARVEARAQLVTDAKRLLGDADFDPKGKTDLEIQKAAVSAKLGDEKVKGKADGYFATAFDALALSLGDEDEPEARRDPIVDAYRQEPQRRKDAEPTYEERMSSRWNSTTKAA